MLFLIGSSSAQLSENFYANKCPKVLYAVKSVVQSAVAKEPRMGASLLRLFFHDCFVNVNHSHLNSSLFIYLTYIHYNTLSAQGQYLHSFSSKNFLFFHFIYIYIYIYMYMYVYIIIHERIIS